MFSAETYTQRRRILCDRLDGGLVLLLGHRWAPRNAAANAYPFRQDSTVLYYLGLNEADLAALIDVETGTTTLFGDDPDVNAIVWTGPLPTIDERAERVGITQTAPLGDLGARLREGRDQGRPLHRMPAYRPETTLALQDLCGDTVPDPSPDLLHAVVAQRSTKSPDEVAQIEIALDVSARIHTHAMRAIRPGLREREIVGALDALAALAGLEPSFRTIFSVHGETLHNLRYDNLMAEGDVVIHDSGVESELGYASDITRTVPVSGTFSERQRDLYTTVLDMQDRAIAAIRPGVPFRDIHRTAATALVEGLRNLGLMRGDAGEAVEAGAHTLFFPHGLGHLLGLDVHDMEALGEDYVGYSDTIHRDERFGWNKLRFARELETDFVLTVEPGIYFIPALIDQWHAEKRLAEFIAYDRVETFRDARGYRVEDDVLVTSAGSRVLGPGIPRTVTEVEAACQA